MRRDTLTQACTIAVAALLAAATTAACNGDRERPTQDVVRPPVVAPAPTTDVDTVKEHPGRFYDKKVRVTGEVDELYSDRAFRLEGTGWAFDDDITVLMKKPMDAAAGGALQDDDELVVSGTVRRFVVADVERDIGWDLSPEIEIKLKERPVLVADSVRKVGPPVDKDDKDDKDDEASGPIDTVAEIVAYDDQSKLAGQKIDLANEKVQSVAGKGLWVGPSDTEKMWVVPPTLPKDVVAGDIVAISGTLREVPADVIAEWDLPKEIARDLAKRVYVDGAVIRELDDRRH